MKYVVGGVFSQKVIFEDEETVVQTLKQEPYQAWSGRHQANGRMYLKCRRNRNNVSDLECRVMGPSRTETNHSWSHWVLQEFGFYNEYENPREECHDWTQAIAD